MNTTPHTFLQGRGISRRVLIQAAAAVPAAAAAPATGLSPVFRVSGCPVHDGQLRHVGLDALLHLLAGNGTLFYQAVRRGPMNGRKGMIAADDVVVLKVNARWKCRGCTDTDMLRGLIHRILKHPDGFRGEVDPAG